jgi:hypothetical protein
MICVRKIFDLKSVFFVKRVCGKLHDWCGNFQGFEDLKDIIRIEFIKFSLQKLKSDIQRKL